MTKKIKGSCYIGVVGSETENDEARDTIENIKRRAGDTKPIYIRATKGYEARQMHLNNWYELTNHEYLFLLDRDMKYPRMALERLRNHKLPYVAGLYLRRRYNPIAPVWFEYSPELQMPMTPFTAVIQPNMLYKIGASGWGCVLIRRDVVKAVKALLKGEPEILEDDMDIYPYDLEAVMQSLRELDNLTLRAQYTEDDKFAIRECIERLQSEIRPLRGLKDTVGSDIRFPFYARLAGFDLWGDAGVMCEHMLNYPLSPMDYVNQSAANVRDTSLAVHNSVRQEIEKIKKAKERL